MSNRQYAISVVGEVAQEHQYILFQDGDHTKDANYTFFCSKDNIDTLADAGVKHIVWEGLSDRHQPLIEKYYAGEITKERLIEDLNYWGNQPKAEKENTERNFADMLDYAAERGIQIHSPDSHGMFTLLDGAVARGVGDKAGFGNTMSTKHYIHEDFHEFTIADMLGYLREVEKDDNLTPSQILDTDKRIEALEIMGLPLETELNSKELKEALSEKVREERTGADKKLAEYIEANTNGEKTAIIYGMAHGAKPEDLDEHLGNDKVGKIGLIPNAEGLEIAQKSSLTSEMPATIIFTDYSYEEGHQVMVANYEDKEVGDEIDKKEFSSHNLKDKDGKDLVLPEQVIKPMQGMKSMTDKVSEDPSGAIDPSNAIKFLEQGGNAPPQNSR